MHRKSTDGSAERVQHDHSKKIYKWYRDHRKFSDEINGVPGS